MPVSQSTLGMVLPATWLLAMAVLATAITAPAHAQSDLPPCTAAASGQALRSVAVGTVGSLRDIAGNELHGKTPLSALPGAGPLWALGMPYGLDRELLVASGQVSTGSFEMRQRYHVDHPEDVAVSFLVYSRISSWCAVAVPPDVRDFKAIEAFVAEAATRAGLDVEQPVPFRLTGRGRHLKWFVVGGMGNLQPDPRTSFLRARVLGNLDDVSIEAAGFYVRHHRGALTNLSSDVHIHFRTTSGPEFVGHLDDEIALEPGATLLLPAPEAAGQQ